MAFDVTALSAYVEQEDFALMSQMQATGGMQDIARIQVGIKGSSALQFLNTDVVFQADSCSNIEICRHLNHLHHIGIE